MRLVFQTTYGCQAESNQLSIDIWSTEERLNNCWIIRPILKYSWVVHTCLTTISDSIVFGSTLSMRENTTWRFLTFSSSQSFALGVSWTPATRTVNRPGSFSIISNNSIDMSQWSSWFRLTCKQWWQLCQWQMSDPKLSCIRDSIHNSTQFQMLPDEFFRDITAMMKLRKLKIPKKNSHDPIRAPPYLENLPVWYCEQKWPNPTILYRQRRP